ncbi:MAG: hypothetical protein HY683_05365 [Chloroflexi bacterium]|nr:hypothetical protein [Chloroflexota bacterium]
MEKAARTRGRRPPSLRRGTVPVKGPGRVFHVAIASSPRELDEARRLDNLVFGPAVGVKVDELSEIGRNGYLLLLRGVEGDLQGQSQMLVRPIGSHPDLASDEVYCYATALRPELIGSGLGRVLAMAQEVCARWHRRRRMTLAVRPENGPSIRMRFALGFRIVGYDPSRYAHAEGPERGGRVIMEKVLDRPGRSHETWQLVKALESGTATLVRSRELLEQVAQDRRMLAIPTHYIPEVHYHSYDPVVRELVAALCRYPYEGIGWLRPEEHHLPFPDGDIHLLVFQPRTQEPPATIKAETQRQEA